MAKTCRLETSPDQSCAPLDIVNLALKNKGVSVQEIKPDDQQLDGADAKYISSFSCILIRNDITSGKKAELLAHELAHIVLHASASACEADGIDLNSLEGGALARANAYGPRERRELQANVFGREFLFPREYARKMFLSERLGAERIANQLGLELALIRLQLIDALLCEDHVDQQEGEKKPSQNGFLLKDESQDAAAEYSGKSYLLEAGPGSGKTRTLVKRVQRLLSKDIRPENILALTFSNKAAGELSDRISRVDQKASIKIWSGTFHAFGLEILRRHYDKLGLPADPRLIGKTEAVELLEERLPVMGLNHFHDLRSPGLQLDVILDAISRAKDELIEAPRYEEMASESETQGLSPEAAERAIEAARVYEEYERAKREHGLIDYGDLVMLPTLLLQRNGEVRKQEAARYSEILVDEYQDVNRASAEMLKVFFEEGARLWVVGDARQSLYRFRGASSKNMALFEDDFLGAKRGALSFNYRSSEPIVAACRSFATEMKATHKKSLPYNAESRGPEFSDIPLTIVTESTMDVGSAVAAEIKELSKQGVDYSQQVILSPTNDGLDDAATALAHAGIPSVHLGSLFEREEVRDVLSILSLIGEPVGSALSRVGTLPGTELCSADISVCLIAAREAKTPLVELLSDPSKLSGVSQAGEKSIEKIATQIEGFSKEANAFDIVLTWLLDRSDYVRNLALKTDVPSSLSRAALLRLFEVIRDRDLIGRPLTPSAVLKRIRSIVSLREDRGLKEAQVGDGVNAVRLMTIHGAKGLEFPAVHILNINEETFPGKPKKDNKPLPHGIEDSQNENSVHLEERECQFFVAISRAEKYLRLYRSSKVAKVKRTKSTFLNRIATQERQASPVPAPSPSFDAQPPNSVREGLSLQDLRDYQQCPLKIAYRRSLGIRSRRHESPFLKTTAVLYGVVDKLPTILASNDIDESIKQVADTMWDQRGPVGDALEPEYRALAHRHIQTLQQLVTEFDYLQDTDISIDLQSGVLIVPPPLVRRKSNGKTVARFVEAGAATSSTGNYLADRLRKLAALQTYGQDAEVEIAHVATAEIVPLKARPTTLNKAQALAVDVLADIKNGNLRPKPDRRLCVRCPYFFCCPGMGAKS